MPNLATTYVMKSYPTAQSLYYLLGNSVSHVHLEHAVPVASSAWLYGNIPIELPYFNIDYHSVIEYHRRNTFENCASAGQEFINIDCKMDYHHL